MQIFKQQTASIQTISHKPAQTEVGTDRQENTPTTPASPQKSQQPLNNCPGYVSGLHRNSMDATPSNNNSHWICQNHRRSLTEIIP